MSTRPIATELFTAHRPPHLIGGRDRLTGRCVFPMPADTDRYEACQLPNRGQLWSYTVQRFAPKSPPYAGPVPFEPFALGYVELAGALIVESRLIDVAFENLRIGMPLELAVVPFRTDPDGTVVTTFAFRPLRERQS